MKQITDFLMAHSEPLFGDGCCRTLHTVERSRVVGVRTPLLRQYARQMGREPWVQTFLEELPHTCFEEYQLHAFFIAADKDFASCIRAVERFLPYIDNWATCDQLSPVCFRRHRQDLLPCIGRWLQATQTYTVRFGIKMLMDHFLDEDFRPEYIRQVACIRSGEYYIRMMQAWYMATALAKQWEAAVQVLEQDALTCVPSEQGLDRWTRNKAIQKACESYRLTAGQKDYLRTLKN